MSVLAALVALAGAQPDLKISEILLPRSDSVALAAILDTTGATDGELAALGVLARCWEQGSRVYTRAATASTSGVVSMPRAEVGEGYMLLRLEVLKSSISTGAQMLASILTEPALDEDAVRSAFATSAGGFRGNVSATDVTYVWRKFVQPAKVNMCGAGEMPRYASEAALKQATWTWPEPPARREFLRQTRVPLDGVDGEASIWTLRHAVPSNEKSLAVAGLTACLLGIGKESAMFKVLRTDLAYSYRQEAMVMPSAKGWTLGLVATSTQKTTLEVLAKQRAQLAERVKSWTEADLKRGRRQWSSQVDGIFPFGPLWSSGDEPLGSGPWAESGLGALTRARFGTAVSQAKLLELAEKVTVEEVKQMALATLDQGQARIIPAR